MVSRHEVLRGVVWNKVDKLQMLKKYLAAFPILQINKEVSDTAHYLYRFDKANYSDDDRNFEKYRFDAFHVATAKVYNLQLLSADADIEKINKLYQAMEEDFMLLSIG